MISITFYIYIVLVFLLSFSNRAKSAVCAAFVGIVHISVVCVHTFPHTPKALTTLGMIFLFGACIYLLRVYDSSQKIEIKGAQSELERKNEQLSLLQGKNSMLVDRNKLLERSLNEIVNIYEYVKTLSSTMEFNEAVSAFGASLNSLTRFTNSKLILLEDGVVTLIQDLSTTKESADKISLKDYENNVIHAIIKNPVQIIHEKGNLSPLGVFPKEIETFAALPLIVEKQILGVIIVENIPLVDIDKINFIVLQFALEVKKTQLYKKVKELSTIDGLTHLYLRRHFLMLLSNELDRGYRQNQSLSFLLIDVDYFKRCNDEYGHLMGDFILKKTASILKDHSREIDILCRYGGDEFAFILPRTSGNDALIVAERLRRSVNDYVFNITSEQLKITVSIGVASCAPNDMRCDGTAEKIIDKADKALYQAKSEGRNKVVYAA